MGASSGMSVEGVTFRLVPVYRPSAAERKGAVVERVERRMGPGPGEEGNSCRSSSRAGDMV